MIDVKDIQGNIILSVPITESAQKVEELMSSDYIQLSWNSDSSDSLLLGSYIEYEGEKYSLIDPYTPSQKNEVEFVYTPQFNSEVMAWGKMPFFFYSQESKEPDWTMTSNPADFMRCVCDAIKNETGDEWTYSVDASLPASASLSFTSVDILSGLNQIAGAFETEWFASKSERTIYLGLVSHGEAVTLEVGRNINVPSVQGGREGYYTRFYAFGSTRNITQDYDGANTNNLVNKRLTLDPTKYPNGYKDIRECLSEGEIFSKVLIFDEVYPSANLSISGVRNRLMYRLDANGDRIQVGTDNEGNPIYDQYAIWYFRIEGFDFDTSNIIEGYNLSVSFQSGALSGREFELKYYEKDTTITTSDGITFEAKKGDYEILFIEEGSYVIPSMTGLIPSDGDNVILFNIKMPEEYTQSAYLKLEAELDKKIAELTSDLNNYTAKSNPVAFHENNPNLTVGRKVYYVNGDYSYTTRVMKLITHLDIPAEQEITFGNKKVKGNTQQLREEVASANKDLNLLAVFNGMTQSIQQSYARTQQMMLEGFAAIKDIWQIKEAEDGEKYAWSAFNVVTQKGITSYTDSRTLDLPGIYDGLPIDNQTLYWELDENGKKTVLKAKGGGEGTLTGIEIKGEGNAITDVTPSSDGAKLVFSKGLTFVDKSYLDENFYTKTYIADTFYTKQYIEDVFFKKDDATDLFVTLDETEQEILGIKVFKEGIKIGNSRIHQSQDGVLFLDGHLVVSGSVTMYGDNGDIDIPTIWAGLPIDENTLVRNEEGVLMVNPNIELGGASSWDEITGKPEWIGTSKPEYSYNEIKNIPDLSIYASKDALKDYVSLAGTESVEGIKDFVNGIAIDGLSIYKSQDDVVYVDANLVVRGAVVMYGNAIADIPSFMESLLLDENTLTLNEEGRLTVIGGTGGGSIEHPLSWSGYSSGSYDGSAAKNFYIPSKVSELTNDSSFITSSALNGYATETWVNGKGFITSSALSGYATESYVTSRGYITSSALSGYATESWVNGKGYLTSSSLNGYATQSWVTGQGYATSAALGNYLPKTGGTMTGNLWIPSAYAKISAATSGNAFISFFNSGGTSALGDIGVLSTAKPAFYDYGAQTWLNLAYNTNWCLLNMDSSSNPYLRLRHSSGTTHYVQNYNSYLYLGAGSSKSLRIDTNGNCLAVGGITQYSDERKKTIIGHVQLSLREIADAPLIEHYYNSDERKTTHVGSIAQYWAGLNDWFCKKDDDGYYTMEIQNASLASAISLARELLRYETKTDKQIKRLKKRINELEEEIEKLKTA